MDNKWKYRLCKRVTQQLGVWAIEGMCNIISPFLYRTFETVLLRAVDEGLRLDGSEQNV